MGNATLGKYQIKYISDVCSSPRSFGRKRINSRWNDSYCISRVWRICWKLRKKVFTAKYSPIRRRQICRFNNGSGSTQRWKGRKHVNNKEPFTSAFADNDNRRCSFKMKLRVLQTFQACAALSIVTAFVFDYCMQLSATEIALMSSINRSWKYLQYFFSFILVLVGNKSRKLISFLVQSTELRQANIYICIYTR